MAIAKPRCLDPNPLKHHRGKVQPEFILTFNCIKPENRSGQILGKSTYFKFKKLYTNSGSAPIQSSIFIIFNITVGSPAPAIGKAQSPTMGRSGDVARFPSFRRSGRPPSRRSHTWEPRTSRPASDNVLSCQIKWAIKGAKLCHPRNGLNGKLRIPDTL